MINTFFQKSKLKSKGEEFATLAAMQTGITTMLQAQNPSTPGSFNGVIIHFTTGFNSATNMYYYSLLYVEITE